MSTLAAVGLLAAACGGSADLLTDGTGTSDAGPIASWVLRSADPAIVVPDGVRITLDVKVEDGIVRIGGTAACNGYGGEVTIDDGVWGTIDGGGYAITEMGCEPAIQAAEQAYMAALAVVDRWERVDASTLLLTGAGVSLTFDVLEPVAPASFTGTTWEVDGFVQGAGADGAVSSTIGGVAPAELRFEDDGTFTLATGCRDFAGDWTATGDEVQMTSWGQTTDSRGVDETGERRCDQAATSQEDAILAVVEGAFTTVVDGQRLTLMNGDIGLTLRTAPDAG